MSVAGRDCAQCRSFKCASEFSRDARNQWGLKSVCNKCRRENYRSNRHVVLQRSREYYQKNRDIVIERERIRRESDIPYSLWSGARRRAKRDNVEFSIKKSDIIIPDKCPVLGIPLMINRKVCGPNSPTLDRVIPAKGYILGNILVISFKANTIKNDAAIAELQMVADFYSSHIWAALGVAVTAGASEQ